VTARAENAALALLGLAGLALIVVVAPVLGDVRIDEFFADPVRSLVTMLVAALLMAGFVLRPLWASSSIPFAPRFVVGAYFILLFLGTSAISALRLFAELGYPIAATQRLPTVAQTVHAVSVASLGGAFLVLGSVITATLTRPGRSAGASADPSVPSPIWPVYRHVVPVLVAIGLLGCVVITGATGQVPLFARDIDALRFSQASGLGFASLFQYELLLVACLAMTGLVVDPGWRSRWALYLFGSLVSLAVFRVERTPLVVVFFVLIFTLVGAGRRFSPIKVISIAALVVAIVVGLGLVRLASSYTLEDKREAVVRPLFDVAPELREQAYVYEIYPELQSHTAARDLAAIASSVVPGKALALIGVDKSQIYTDVSRDYSATMRQLGYYPYNEKPLRIGLIGELYADFGMRGVIFGLFGFGLLVGLIPLRAGVPSSRLMPLVLLGVLTTMLLITPPPALLPIAVMLLGPLFVVHRWVATR
jgi:hypothetical protein